MRTTRLSIALCWALVLSLASGQPTLFTLPDLFVFGDSLSDTGNMLALFNGSFPSPVYWQGRFTNSPGAWVDQVKNAVTTVPDIVFPTVTNYAYGGATACYYPNITGKQAIIPSMRQMVQKYLAQPIKPGKKVIVLWGGHNDIMSAAKLPNKKQVLAIPPQIIACITDMAGKIARADKDATVLIASLAPLQLTPYLKSVPIVPKLINTLNKGLKNGARLQGLLTKGRVAYWDINTLLANSINKIDPLMFPKGASKPCVIYKIAFDGFFKNLSAKPDSVCTDPDNYIFYDPVHPSARAQAVIARAYFSRLAELKLVESALNFLLNARINV